MDGKIYLQQQQETMGNPIKTIYNIYKYIPHII